MHAKKSNQTDISHKIRLKKKNITYFSKQYIFKMFTQQQQIILKRNMCNGIHQGEQLLKISA